ncbi:MAG TPA: DNA-binding response regulator [Chloroflexi bacterium]|nr:DNA-binding response regulator [Chloroflexota bacterium]
MRVLVVEDDPRLGPILQQGLEEDGIGVDLVESGEEAVSAALSTAFDVISLDVMIPRQDGFGVCVELRRRRVETPILMLTARDAVSDRVRGLDSGADDYLTKPFAFEEFLARIRALARRHLVDRTAHLEAGTLRLDTRGRTATVGGSSLSLTMKEFAILEYLMHNPDRLLSQNQIAEHVWDYTFSSESNLVEVYIARLRRKLRAAGLDNQIVTVRHGGYRFVVP